MFLILPHSAEVRHGTIPWVVAITTLLCIGIYMMQDSRYEAITDNLKPYCESIYDADLDEDAIDFLRVDKLECTSLLTFIHDLPEKDTFTELMRIWSKESEKASKEKYTEEEVEEAISLAQGHYNEVLPKLPPSLDAKLVYDPKVPNPIQSLLSALSHGSWWHLIGNIIFFLAFAPAIEFIIASPWRFILAMVAIELFCDVAYSFTIFLGAEPYPTLGLSGVVSGMIGMAAYLMPNVRIRTFIWIMWFARNVHIPAAILAIWYIGWDTYYLLSSEWSTGVNLVAHVSAGFAGYFIARFWFKQRREETRDEVDDEVEYMRAQRQDKLGIMSSYRGRNNHLSNVYAAEQANRDYATWASHIHTAINTNQDAEAVNLILSRYEEYRHAIELYEELYQEMLKWKHSRAVLCLSRLLIGEYLETRKYAKAIQVAQTAYMISSEFVFAEEKQKTLLVAMAKRQGITLEPTPTTI